ncbi:MAG: ABC transporter ATP-binding protein [Synergistetes bacterium]|nr:ABC transporter ATP-binding protein [Synergistota bacterium]MCX8127228.1 ABC transporter ATP-binding protein [Synergistota bacterium]MDW8191886.1 ABC transporter ATP-binding protein [Synergistota bacterium]
MPLLELLDVHLSYGKIKALKGVSIKIEQGELVTIIGANGAGKTSILRSIMGLERIEKGEIFLEGKLINGMAPHLRAQLGIRMVPEGARVFPDLTVEENLRVGALPITDKKELRMRMDKIFEVFPALKERVNQLAGTMSGGERQMLSLGRALMSNPKLLMIDEASLGLMPILVEKIYEAIMELKRRGITILLVEQNARQALKVADRGYVLETGQIVLEGSAKELSDNPMVKRAYLGG